MTEQATKKKEIVPAKLSFFTRAMLTLDSCVVVYLIIATHFLFSVRTAHFLGDVSYIPPSILRYTGVIFRAGEVEAGAQIVFFILWLLIVVVSCVAIFMVTSFLATQIIGFFTKDETVEAAIWDCMGNAFMCLLPILILSLLTLLIMPLESSHPSVDSTSLTQIGEMLSFSEFLFTMTQATFIIFLVCFLVVITVAVAYLLSFILPDNGGFFFFVSMFIGVCVGVAVIFVLGYYGNLGFEYLKLKTGNAYFVHYLVFGIYAGLCTAMIAPSVIKEKKKTTADLREKINSKKFRKKKSPQSTEIVIPDINF